MAGGASKPGMGTASSSDEGLRLLVVATQEIAAEALPDELRERLEDRSARALIVVPALTESPLKHAMGDVDAAIEEATGRLDSSVERIRSDGIEVEGTIGDSDPILAIEDALREFPADEIVIVTRPDDDAAWLEDSMFERARERFEPPLVHLVAGSGTGEARQVERSGRGTEAPDDAETSGQSRNTPPLSVRDVASIVVALVGMIVLVVLAATCTGEAVGGESTDSGCVARYIIAGITALVNIAHVVGLLLFQAVRYRGAGAQLFSWLSLIGTPLAIVAALLVH